jgi:hypothetical protein
VSARALLAGAIGSGLAAVAMAGPPELRIDAPAPETATRLPLIEVSGGAGRGAGERWEIAIVLDLSESTLHPSGLDLDGDGPDGRSDLALLARYAPAGSAGSWVARRLAEVDFEDTILAAELEAAQALVVRSAGPRIRTGLVGFSDRAQVLAPLTSSRTELEQAFAALRFRLAEHLRGTHYAAALAAAQHMLAPGPAAANDGARRAIVFLSDGAPSLPVFGGDHGRSEALAAARELGLAGIQIFAFAFGNEAADASEVLAQMADWTEGRAERSAHPERLVTALRELALVDVARVAITNATTGLPARAVRLFPDGSFDALLGLAEGRNVLRVEAFAGDGTGVWLERTIERLPGAAEADEATRGRELLGKLRDRTAEMEAWAEVERRRREERRSVTILPAPRP